MNDISTVNNPIVTSLCAYKDTLFVANINGYISLFPLPKKSYHKYLGRDFIEFNPLRGKTNGFVTRMQGYRDYLFIATTKSIHSYTLRKQSELQEVFSKEISHCTNICIDGKKGYLFGVSQTRGLVAININDPENPTYQSDLRFLNLEILSDYHVADLDVHNGSFFLALRNYGILRVDYRENEYGEPKIDRELQKIKLVDPQDVKYSPSNKLLYIADAENGFIMLDTTNGSVTSKRLPNNDTPIQLLTIGEKVVIKGDRGVYYFNNKHSEISTIFNFDVGPITSYYNDIYFTIDGQLGMLCLQKNVNWDDYFINENYSYFKFVYSYDGITRSTFRE